GLRKRYFIQIIYQIISESLNKVNKKRGVEQQSVKRSAVYILCPRMPPNHALIPLKRLVAWRTTEDRDDGSSPSWFQYALSCLISDALVVPKQLVK
ncbi:MAG: hypothetical protein ACI9R8_001711, partial [Candidatus Paceibacteria bacterium]